MRWGPNVYPVAPDTCFSHDVGDGVYMAGISSIGVRGAYGVMAFGGMLISGFWDRLFGCSG